MESKTRDSIEEKWHECDFVGTIKIFDNAPKLPKEPIENMDDYDMRHGFGCKVHVVNSIFKRMEM